MKVTGKDYPIYEMEQKMFETTNQKYHAVTNDNCLWKKNVLCPIGFPNC